MKKTILLCTALLATSVYAAPPDLRALELKVDNLKAQLKELQDQEPYARGSTVVTSPLIGMREAYDASDLIVNLSSVNEDLKLLLERQKIAAYAHKKQLVLPRRPIISLSGAVEGKAVYNEDYSTNSVDVDLSRAEVDVIGEINPWVTTAILITYDSSKLPDSSRITNSGLQVDRGFITLGNINKCPLYFTVGQLFVPFGEYSNYMVTTPSTNILGKIKQRAAVLGYFNHGWNASLYTYQGDTHVVGSTDVLKRGGANLSYTMDQGKIRSSFGIGYVGNIAESQGMQITNLTQFPGFDGNNETLAKRVPAMNAHAKLEFGPKSNQFNLVAEYIGAMRDFSRDDLTFNDRAAKPRALDVEGQYEFTMYAKPAAISAGYGRTWDALAINLPQHNYFASFHTSLWQDTIESIEYRHDINYAANNYATGGTHNGGAIIQPAGSKHRNVVTLQLGVYF